MHALPHAVSAENGDAAAQPPGFMYTAAGRTDYFATYNWTEEWTMGGQTALMSFWNRPLHAMTDASTAAGFRISVISEPQPAPTARELFPDDFRMLASSPSFLFFVLHAN